MVLNIDPEDTEGKYTAIAWLNLELQINSDELENLKEWLTNAVSEPVRRAIESSIKIREERITLFKGYMDKLSE